MSADDDTNHMMRALALAEPMRGRTAPNPAVGCVIVKKGKVVGEAATAPGGRPHAETQALEKAGTRAKGADVYVSLEPCAHHGVTPPCAEALVQAQPARVIIACRDDDPRTNGQGIEILKKAGIEVTEGVLEAEARAQNATFFARFIRSGRS